MRHLCEFGTNPFSGSPEIFHTQTKKVTDSAKNRTLHSSLSAAKNGVLNVPVTESIDLTSSISFKYHSMYWYLPYTDPSSLDLPK